MFNYIKNKSIEKNLLFSNLFPKKNALKKELLSYKSNISINKFKNKLYEDPIYGTPQPDIRCVYSILNGNWLISEDVDDYGNHILKFTDDKSGQYIKIAFPNHTNKIKFVNEMSTSKNIEQENYITDIETIINTNNNHTKKNIVTGIVATLLTGIGIFTYKNLK